MANPAALDTIEDRATANGRPIEDPSRPIEFHVSRKARILVELTAIGELQMSVIGTRYDLPPAAKSLKDARPTWAVPCGDGDRTVVTGLLKL